MLDWPETRSDLSPPFSPDLRVSLTSFAGPKVSEQVVKPRSPFFLGACGIDRPCVKHKTCPQDGDRRRHDDS